MHDNVLAPVTFSVVLVLVLSAVPVAAQSAAELLEKGIYLEETAGRLDRAIQVYRRIVTDATAGRAHVAEALLRLGLCQLEKGDSGAAIEAFDRLLAEYPEQESFVTRAREHMPEKRQPPLALLPAPWEDGEVMRLALELASGTPIGAMLITAAAAELEGEELWRLRGRHRVISDADNQAIREVLARRDDMVPVRSRFRHSVAGHFEGEYVDGVLRVETVGAGKRREEKLGGETFDSEELFHLFRRLPLEVGFKSTIRFISVLAGGANEVEVEVAGVETVTVPAGEFECYRVEISAPQVFWYSTDPSRLLVKFEASGIVGELEEVYVQEPGRESVYSDEMLGLGVTLPPDWLFHVSGAHPTDVVFLLDPNAEAQARMEIRRAEVESGDCFYQLGAQRKLAQARAALRDYALRNGSWREWYFDGWPAVSFAGDYLEAGAGKVHYWTLIQNGEFCVDFTLKVAADRFEALRPTFDAIIESYRAPPLPASELEASAAADAVRSVLTDLHLAASEADPERFFEHLASDAIFLGPDAADRFDVEALRERYSEVSRWLGEASERQVTVSEDEALAWFDERLASAELGELRASGVLRAAAGRPSGWQIVQLHVTMPVPNQLLVEQLVEELSTHDRETGRASVDFSTPITESADAPAGSAGWLLRDVHLAKTEGDGERYFGLFAPEAVMLGTDRSERFSLAAYRAVFGPYFLSGGRRPPTIPIEQHVYLSPGGDMAWFEELVERQHLGRMRGTGVMRRVDGAWKFVHRNVTLVVPHELAEDVARRIDAFYAPVSAPPSGPPA